MTKQWMILNGEISSTTFVFFNWINDANTSTSWRVRDFSSPGKAKIFKPQDFRPGLSPASILASATVKEPAKGMNTEIEHEYWHNETLRLNFLYLGKSNGAAPVGEKPVPEPLPPRLPSAETSTPSCQYASTRLSAFFVPTTSTDDWRRLLADPVKHWRDGYSAKLLAERWQPANGFPSEVKAALAGSAVFRDIEFLCGFPEHKVPIPGGERASQNDILVLARTPDSLVSIAVEGKGEESFGPLLADWSVAASDGKVVRLQFLLDILGLPQAIPGSTRYQLLHRATSAVIEATRFHARHAVLLVHSFSPANSGFGDFASFLQLHGQQATEGTVITLKQLGDITLHACWVCG